MGIDKILFNKTTKQSVKIIYRSFRDYFEAAKSIC